MKAVIKSLAALVFASVALSGASVHAAENPMNEIGASTSSALTFGTGYTTTFNIAVDYSRTLMDMLQATVVGGFATGGGTSILNLQAGPTFDLALDNTGIRNAVFLRATGGIAYTNASGGSTNFAYGVSVGKRTELFNAISWDPTFGIACVTSTGSNAQFQLIPIAMSFIF